MITEWVLFQKENGRIGILPLGKYSASKTPICEFHGTLEQACNKAEEIEREEVKDVR